MAKRGRFDEAITEYEKALQIRPEDAGARTKLGIILAERGRLDEAITHFQKALEIKPDDPNTGNNLGVARSQREGLLKALARQRELLRSRPNDLALLNDIAWLLATNPNASLRNGAEAIKLAEQAVRLSDEQEPAVFGTLAAAYAEAGRFPEAVQTAERALTLATGQNNTVLAETLQTRIKLYQAGLPYRDTPQPPVSKSIRP